MEIVKDTVIGRDKNALAAKLDDEIIMMDSESGNYFNLNRSAVIIWEMLENGPLTFDEMCKTLIFEFEVDYETCSNDAKKFILDMFHRRVITISNN